jgi:hypothetical protein
MRMTGIQGTCCFGWDSIPLCDNKWEGQDFQDIQSAFADLVTQDGQFSRGKAGRWLASFDLLTTAFRNRDTPLFALGLTLALYGNQPAGSYATVYHFSRDGDYATVESVGGAFGIGTCP